METCPVTASIWPFRKMFTECLGGGRPCSALAVQEAKPLLGQSVHSAQVEKPRLDSWVRPQWGERAVLRVWGPWRTQAPSDPQTVGPNGHRHPGVRARLGSPVGVDVQSTAGCWRDGLLESWQVSGPRGGGSEAVHTSQGPFLLIWLSPPWATCLSDSRKQGAGDGHHLGFHVGTPGALGGMRGLF